MNARALSAFAAVVIVAVLARILFSLNAPVFFEGDARGYFLRAVEIASGQGINLSLKRTPGYSLLLSGIFAITGPNLDAVTVVQHVFGVLTAAATFWCASMIAGWRAGLIAGLLTGLSGSQLIYERVILTESWFTLILVGFTGAIIYAIKRDSARALIAGGVLAGLSSLVRPVGMSVAGAVALLSIWAWGFRRGPRYLVMFALGIGLVMLPWSLRNVFTHGEATPVHPGRFLIERTVKYNPTGISMYADFNLREDTPDVRAGRRVILEIESRKPDSAEIFNALSRRLNLGDAATSELMWKLAVTAVKRHPDLYIAGTITQFGQIIQGQPESVEAHVAIRRQSWKGRDLAAAVQGQAFPDLLDDPMADDPGRTSVAELVAQIYQPGQYVEVLLLLAAGATVSSIISAQHRVAGVPFMIALSLLVCSAIVVGYEPRYRYPIDPLLHMSAAAGLVWLTAWLVQHWQRRHVSEA